MEQGLRNRSEYTSLKDQRDGSLDDRYYTQNLDNDSPYESDED